MKVQVLGSVMNQKNIDIIEKMNINTDAIIINQCDRNDYKKIILKNDKKVEMFSFKERGVGLSRNNALMRATGDIVVFADEDERFVDGYEKIIIETFEKNPKADIIMFNVPSTNPERPLYNIKKNFKVKWYNCLRYGAVKITARRESIQKHNIFFSLLFGRRS